MKISISDIQKICNYSEQQKSSPGNITISYIDHVSDRDFEYLQKIKNHNRNLAISAVLDDNIDDYQNREIIDNISGNLSVLLKSMVLYPKKITSLENMYNEILSHLDNITSQQYTKNGITSLNVTASKLDCSETLNRKIQTKILRSANIISHYGRIGPATTVIVGMEAYALLEINKSFLNPLGIDIILSDKLHPTKVIVMKSSTNFSNNGSNFTGLIVVNNISDGNYYMKESSNWDNQIVWFEVI